MTIEVSDTRSAGGSAKAHKPSGKSTVTKPIHASEARFPLLDETVVCQPMPLSKPLPQSKAKVAKPRAGAHCVVIRPMRPSPKAAATQRAHAPRKARVASATKAKAKAKLSAKKKKGDKKKKWVPERVFVRPSVSIGALR